MGFRRLIKGLVAVTVAVGLSLPAYCQPSPQTTPTTTFQNDVVVTGNVAVR